MSIQSDKNNSYCSGVNFNYSFAPPHRITTALPDSSDKTLLDVQHGSLSMSWTYDNLVRFPLASFATPVTAWQVTLKPAIDCVPFPDSSWTRIDGYLPALENTYRDFRGIVKLEAMGCKSAAIIKVFVKNTGDKKRSISVSCSLPAPYGHGYNPAWVDNGIQSDTLLAGWADRADRILILATGAQSYPVTKGNEITMQWNLQPGECSEGMFIRPYRAFQQELDELRAADWSLECDNFFTCWRDIYNRSFKMAIPDCGVLNAYMAGLADLFIMREPVADGYIAATPGTEVYRAANPIEAGITAVAIDQAGLHSESEIGFRMPLAQQGDDGNWADPKGWGHLFWSTSGYKAWVVIHHYKLTRDKSYLEDIYPRMLASSRFQ